MLPNAVRQFVNRSAYIAANNWLAAGEGRRTSMMITGPLDSPHPKLPNHNRYITRLICIYIYGLANSCTKNCNAKALFA